MISPIALKRYRARRLDDHSWLKRLSVRKINSILSALRPAPRFQDLRIHQKVGLLLGITYPAFFFLFDMGCVDADTEYLSPTGWKHISKYKGGKVTQYDPDTKEATFVEPDAYIKKPCKWMYRFLTSRGGVDQKLSPEHRVLYANEQGNPYVDIAENIANVQERLALGWRGRFFSSFNIKTETCLDFTDAELRLQVAVIADGHFGRDSTNRCVIRIKKRRKKVRLRRLLQEANVEYRENDKVVPKGFSTFSFISPRHDKVFDEYYWGASRAQLEIIADEVRYWDGCERTDKPSVQFDTREKQSADFVQYAFCATNKTARLHKRIRENGDIDYTVVSREKAMLLYLRGITQEGEKTQPITKEPPTDGYKYCFSVPTGYLVLRRNGCVFLTGNSGKTALALRLVEYLTRIGKIKGIVVVLVPNDAAIWNWEDEIKKWTPKLPYRLLAESASKSKWRTLGAFKRGLVVVSYPGYRALVSELQKKPGAKHKHHVLSDTLTKKFNSRASAMIMDEITACKNSDKLTFKAVNTLSMAVPIRYGLTGRPFGRDPSVLWAQCFLVDHGETFSQSFSFFHEAYFKKKAASFGSTPKFSLTARGKRQVSEALRHRSLSYSVTECLDLPPLIPITRRVEFPPDAMLYYRKMVEALIQQKGNWREVKNVFLRMRQIASGFVGFIDDDTGARAHVEFKDNPKLDELIQIVVEEKPPEEKFVIFHEYNWTGQRICEELSRNKIRHGWLHGGTKNWIALKDQFNTDPKMEGLVVNWRKGGMSLNLQAASVSIFIESPVAPDQREQAERRTWRQGQKKHVRQYDILVKNSVDERIREFHKEGDSLMDALIRNPRKALGL